jgi:hypothetical protein
VSAATIPDWISSIATAAGALAVIWGLLRANEKIDEFQTNTRIAKRAEAAEDLIALALNAEDAFRDMRNPFDSVPVDKVGDAKYAYQRRYDRVTKYSDLFQRLREAQIRQRTLIGDDEVNRAVIELFNARADVVFAIQDLARSVDEETEGNVDRDSRKQSLSDLYGSFSERDELGKKIIGSVQKIEEKLKPFARLEVSIEK